MSAGLLLDTNLVIWILTDDGRISPRVRNAISRSESLAVSVVSAWEIAIKHQAGKLEFPSSLDMVLDEVLYRSPWTILPVQPQHLIPLPQLPLHHKDPFDRLLIAQAQHERLTIVTSDTDIARYPVPVLW